VTPAEGNAAIRAIVDLLKTAHASPAESIQVLSFVMGHVLATHERTTTDDAAADEIRKLVHGAIGDVKNAIAKAGGK